MARPERFELPTPKFVAWCSIQLSYGRVVLCGAFYSAVCAPSTFFETFIYICCFNAHVNKIKNGGEGGIRTRDTVARMHP